MAVDGDDDPVDTQPKLARGFEAPHAGRDRQQRLTSQLEPSDWHDYLADPTLADAICDRLVHQAHRIVLKGPSRRKEPTPKQ